MVTNKIIYSNCKRKSHFQDTLLDKFYSLKIYTMPRKSKRNFFLKGWDKSSVAAMIANLLTFLALIFSYNQNSISDRRYFENDSTSKIESNRIRTRDSSQIATLINSFQAQQSEYKRLRQKDSINISLYQNQLDNLNESLKFQNKGLVIQNKALETQRLANKSYLTLKVSYLPSKYEFGNHITISPVFSVTNVGNTSADNITVNYFLADADLWTQKATCNQGTEIKQVNATIYANSDKNFNGLITYYINPNEDKFRKNKSKLFVDSLLNIRDREKTRIDSMKPSRLKEKLAGEWWKTYERTNKILHSTYIIPSHQNILIARIKYHDKYQSDAQYLYEVHKIEFNKVPYSSVYNFNSLPINPKILKSLKKCILNNNFDYEKIEKMVNSQYVEGEANAIVN